jgi:hypothetical protein
VLACYDSGLPNAQVKLRGFWYFSKAAVSFSQLVATDILLRSPHVSSGEKE